MNFICFDIGLLLGEDDNSLFSNRSKSVVKDHSKSKTGLFDDDDDDDDESSSDLFSTSKSKLSKKPPRNDKIELFDDEDSSLFGSASKTSDESKTIDVSSTSTGATKMDKKIDSKNLKSSTKDIFDDSSEEDDIFAGSKKAIIRKTPASLFDDDDDTSDIFGESKLPSLKESKIGLQEERQLVKKSVTKDLKKTAEKIVEDPLSLLQDE